MYELPLFPLNTVLFPGTPLKLHIFEERYKLMISECYESGKPFGVALIKNGREVGGYAQPFAIGCTAIINQLEPLPEGRMNILALGQERFQIHSLKYDRPYLTGVVESYPVTHQRTADLNESGEILRRWVKRYLEILTQAAETPIEMVDLPQEPLKLAYLASFLLNAPATQKQVLLDIEEADDLMIRIRAIYRREVTLLDMMLTPDKSVSIGPFSPN